MGGKGCQQWMHFSLSNEATCESEYECTRVCDLWLGDKWGAFLVQTMKALWVWQSILFLHVVYIGTNSHGSDNSSHFLYTNPYIHITLPGVPRIFSKDNKPIYRYPLIEHDNSMYTIICFDSSISNWLFTALTRPLQMKRGTETSWLLCTSSKHLSTCHHACSEMCELGDTCQLSITLQLATLMKTFNTGNLSTFTFCRA
jgi:hypothetical protein